MLDQTLNTKCTEISNRRVSRKCNQSLCWWFRFTKKNFDDYV